MTACSWSQQPFFTDDADVTENRKFHFEAAVEFDRLQASSLPFRFQNTVRATLAYGLVRNVDLSVSSQHGSLVSRERPRLIGGIGDTTIAVKYNFLHEREKSRRPALAVSAYVDLPTGNANRGLGGGVYDFGLNGIVQKSTSNKGTLRVNAGYLRSRSTLSSVAGLAIIRGHVFTGSVSYIHTLSDKLQLGGEIVSAVTRDLRLGRGQLLTQFGGNYQLTKNSSLDFGLILGKYAASPRHGLQFGFSRDF